MPGQILVIDPVAANRIVLRSRVAVSCHSVVQADSPDEAFDRVAEIRPDLVLLGPGLTGGMACDMVRRLAGSPAGRGLPVLILTASSDPGAVHADLGPRTRRGLCGGGGRVPRRRLGCGRARGRAQGAPRRVLNRGAADLIRRLCLGGPAAAT